MIGRVGPWTYVAPDTDTPITPAPVPSFSVLITAYNVAPYLGDALRSALAQTVAPLEVIVCDDGSTDDVEPALEPYLDRIRVVRQPNRGPSAAKNAAANVATGDFVVTLDGDDEYAPRRIEALGTLAAARPDLDLVATDGEIVTETATLGRYHTLGVRFNADDPRTEILQHNYLLSPAIRRERFEAIGGYDERLRNADDWDLCLRLVLSGARVGLVDAPLVRYRQREGQLTANKVGLRRSEVQLLETALAEQTLSARERGVAAQALGRSRLLLARAAREELDPGARAAALAVVRDRTISPRNRCVSALTALSPHAARWLARAAQAR